MTQTTTAETLKRALLTIRRLQQQLADVQQAAHEPIAVLGMGCTLPGGIQGPRELWEATTSRDSLLEEIPEDRWEADAYHHPDHRTPGRTVARRGGFVPDVWGFDHEFFGMSQESAATTDPQQRLALETAWHALEDADIPPSSLAGTATGVYMAVCTNDFAQHFLGRPELLTPYSSVGTAHSAVAGAISAHLDLRGPTLAIDTACSSSLVAVHLAVRALRSGEVDTALVGGVNAVVAPSTSVAFSQAGMLSGDGCHPFGPAAQGAVNSEGCVVLVLRRQADALREGRAVIGLISGSAVNHNGRGAALTAPNPAAQREVIQHALADAQVPPEDVAYVEAHASTTPLGDVMEVEAVVEAYAPSPARPLALSTVKGQLGHLQAAGGVTALARALLAVRNGAVPGTCGLRTIHPDLQLFADRVRLPAACAPWPRAEGPRHAAVSTFGFTGTNAHVIVGGPTEHEARPDEDAPEPTFLLPLSARSPDSLRRLAQRYAEVLAPADPAQVRALCWRAAVGRDHHSFRTAVTGATGAELAGNLATALTSELAEAGTTSGVAVWFSGLPSDPEDLVRRLESCCPGLVAVPGPDAADAVPGPLAAALRLHAWLGVLGLPPTAVLGTGTGRVVAAVASGGLAPHDAHDALSGGQPAAVARPVVPLVVAGGGLWPWQQPLDRTAWDSPEPEGPGWAEPGLLDASVDALLCLGAEPVTPSPAPAMPVIPLVSAGADGRPSILPAIAELYRRGTGIRWSALWPGRPAGEVDAPLYPFARA